MLDKIRELSISFWSPVGEFFNSAFGTSNVWFPIIAYVGGSIAVLFIIKKILDKTVSSASSLSINAIGSILRKVILYTVIIGVTLSLVVSLYFYLDKIYHEYHPSKKDQNLDYLLH